MTATLIKKNSYYLCGNCMIKQFVPPQSYCPFCGKSFSNYEEVILAIYREEQENEIIR